MAWSLHAQIHTSIQTVSQPREAWMRKSDLQKKKKKKEMIIEQNKNQQSYIKNTRVKVKLMLREHERFWLLNHKVAKTTTAEVQTPFLGPQNLAL